MDEEDKLPDGPVAETPPEMVPPPLPPIEDELGVKPDALPTPDPWAKVPVDPYWFAKEYGRSPGLDEERVWRFELVTLDKYAQRGRITAQVYGTYEKALCAVKLMFEPELDSMKLKASKIMLLGS